MKNSSPKKQKYRLSSNSKNQAHSSNTEKSGARELFVENFVPEFALSLAKSFKILVIGGSLGIVKKFFFNVDLSILLEVLSNIFYKKRILIW
ncbi:hypothetical protein V1502_02540 [Bacillus sp. SCS-153A]|uniref:hypothetical protein n=1 Tax=Rossellomorea sedimentorum TaxID=3115294 RepID=UPI0039063C63